LYACKESGMSDRTRSFPDEPPTGVSRLFRLLAFVAIFGLAGPPIGGLVAWTTMGARAMHSPVPFVTGAYTEGVALALATGLLTGIAALWFGKVSWTVPVATVIAVDGAFLAASVAGNLFQYDMMEILVRLTGVFLPPSLVAALVCWWLAQQLLVPR
jgi:thiamine transporter ThiT